MNEDNITQRKEVVLTNPEHLSKEELLSLVHDLQDQNRELSDTASWYESILDAIPFPMSVTDMNMSWTFINHATEKMLKVSRKEIAGKHCSNWGANICNTDQCGIKLLRSGKSYSIFEQGGGHFRTDVSYITSPAGEQVGHVEIVTDVTEIIAVKNYLHEEVEKVAHNLEKFSHGDLKLDYSITVADEHTREVYELFTGINGSLKEAADALALMIDDALMLSTAAVEGKLDTRADASRHQGEFRKIVDGVNDTLDAVINPLNVAAEYVDRISKGEIPTKITDTYNGDFNEIKNNLNQCIDVMTGLLNETDTLIKATKEGHLDTRGAAKNFPGDWGTLVGEVNGLIDAFVQPINVTAEYVDRISKGEIPAKITDTYNGDFNEIKNNLNQCIDVMTGLLNETDTLIKATKEGKLDTRGAAKNFPGDWGTLVGGVNSLIDAFVQPINVTAEYVDRISKGEIPAKITDTYNGDFNEIKNNLNSCIDAVNMLVSDAGMLAKAAIEARLDTRADASRHHGDFQKIVEGVNVTLDTLVGFIDKMPLPIMAVSTEFGILYMNDMGASLIGTSKKNLINQKCYQQFKTGDCQTDNCACAQAMQKLTLFTRETDAHPSGKDLEIKYTGLPIRDQNGKVTGAFEFIQDQTASIRLNRYLNREIEAANGCITLLAEGNTNIARDVEAADQYTQEARVLFVGINEKLENLAGSIQALVNDAGILSTAAVEGRLQTRADASKHQGDFQKIVQGVNDTLDAVINPLNVAANYVDRISKGEIPEKITENYIGDFNEIKNNLNQCIDGLQGLVQANRSLQRMAMNDHTIRMEGKYQGIFAEVAEAVNAVQDRVNHVAGSINKISNGDLSELEEYRRVGKRSDEDRIVPGFIRILETLKDLVDDAGMLAKAAVDGKLDTRADASKHQGDFRKIITGVNGTLDSVTVPVKEALRVSKEYSNYQFRARVDPSLKVAGDWIEFKNALDNIGIQIGDAVGIIRDQVLNLASNAEEATASIEEVSSGAQQIASNASGVSINAERGNEGIVQILKAMEDLTVTVSEVSQRAEQVSSSATQANEFSKIGIDLARRSESSMTEITRSSTEVDLIVNEINKQMEEIGKIVRLISDIANQTNLLALNAAIEAARAGDAGRGFAVVAAEVKSLAQDSRKSAENIADMISTLQDKAKKAAIAMAQAGEKVEEGSKSLTETLGAFNKIASSIEDITKNATNVAAASEEQAASVEEVTASINEVSFLLISTAKEAGDAAAATEETSASIEQISKIVSNVSVSVDSVSTEMAKFVI